MTSVLDGGGAEPARSASSRRLALAAFALALTGGLGAGLVDGGRIAGLVAAALLGAAAAAVGITVLRTFRHRAERIGGERVARTRQRTASLPSMTSRTGGAGHGACDVHPAIADPVLSVPVLSVTDRGTILRRNGAARVAIGSGAARLEDAFERSGEGLAVVSTGGWAGRTVELREAAAGDGTRQVLAFPSGGATSAPVKRRAYDDLPIAILWLGPGGSVVEGNQQAADLLNHDLRGGAALGDLVEGLGRDVSQWIDAVLCGTGSGLSETAQVTHAAHETHARITLARVLTDDGPRAIAVLNDATELKTLEAQFVQSQKMQAIGQLAGGIAHDFNNILTAISGYCDLIRMRESADDADREDLNRISENTQRAAAIVNQLLAFSRKQKLEPQPIDLLATFSDLTHLLQQLAGPQARIRYEHDTDLAPIRGDARQIGQVLMNLVINARDAMGDAGGEVSIAARNVLLSQSKDMGAVHVPPGRYVVIEVADQGPGVPRHVLPHIFEPFYTTKEQGKGTGLGLSTVYGIVKQSAGYVFAANRPDGGAVFSLWFPTVKDSPTIPAPSGRRVRSTPVPKAAAPAERRTVLICEDEAPVRAIAAKALGLRGFEVLEADCGEAALGVLRAAARAPDVLLTDVIMPGLDGPGWVRKALESHPGTPVVFMSGYTEGALDELDADTPGARMLAKPFSLDALISTVEQASGGPRRPPTDTTRGP